MTVQKYFITHFKCTKVVILYRCLLLTYMLTATFNSIQNYTFCWPVEMQESRECLYYIEGTSIEIFLCIDPLLSRDLGINNEYSVDEQ